MRRLRMFDEAARGSLGSWTWKISISSIAVANKMSCPAIWSGIALAGSLCKGEEESRGGVLHSGASSGSSCGSCNRQAGGEASSSQGNTVSPEGQAFQGGEGQGGV